MNILEALVKLRNDLKTWTTNNILALNDKIEDNNEKLEEHKNDTDSHIKANERDDWNNKADRSELFSGSYNDLTDKPEIPSIEGLATEEFVNNAITELREEMVILEEDDLTIDGLIDGSFPNLTTEDKTLIGAINEINNKMQNNQPGEGQVEEIEKSVVDEILMDVFGVVIDEEAN